MNLRAWRIVKDKHANTAFTGEGAKVAGGRWNSPGRAVIYTAGSVSLAMLEMLAHLESRELLKRYVLFEATFDESLVANFDARDLPTDWQRSPPPSAVQQLGDVWLREGGSAVLRVPSAIVPTEWNYLLNPEHADFARISVDLKQPVKFDPRLVKG